jgi:excisionase family DNA binding protein
MNQKSSLREDPQFVSWVLTWNIVERLTCTIAEACEATGLGRTKLYELIGAGSLATTTVGRRRLVLVRSLRTLLEADTSQAKGA